MSKGPVKLFLYSLKISCIAANRKINPKRK
jgi:hypothetical protein